MSAEDPGMNTAAAKYKQENSVTVSEMAERREERAAQQHALLNLLGGEGCVVCLNLNIAGPVKRSGLADHAFFAAVRDIRDALFGENCAKLVKSVFVNRKTGIEALFAVRGDAEKIKIRCMGIEEASPAGRLLDIDVIAPDGTKIGRNAPRKCLICGENASVCARSRAHSVEELRETTERILGEALAERTAELAYEALIAEVHATPKPGLVDEMNSGANPDMDIPMFEKSASVLRPFFEKIALAVLKAGRENLDSPALASELRSIGLEAESAMLAATGGVNTHRGAVYTLGLLTAARTAQVAFSDFSEWDFPAERIFPEPAENCARLAGKLAETLGDGSLPSSKGAAVRKEYGVGGAVEQAVAGFPLAVAAKNGRMAYDDLHGEALSLPYALLAVMAELDDNNALRRGGKAGAEFVKKRAAELKKLGESAEPEEFGMALEEFDAELTRMNISCGGAADMLAAGIFLESIGNETAAPGNVFDL